jgi:hypothetical protein
MGSWKSRAGAALACFVGLMCLFLNAQPAAAQCYTGYAPEHECYDLCKVEGLQYNIEHQTCVANYNSGDCADDSLQLCATIKAVEQRCGRLTQKLLNIKGILSPACR